MKGRFAILLNSLRQVFKGVGVKLNGLHPKPSSAIAASKATPLEHFLAIRNILHLGVIHCGWRHFSYLKFSKRYFNQRQPLGRLRHL